MSTVLKARFSLLLCCVTALFLSCAQDDPKGGGEEAQESRNMTFSLRLPGTAAPGTRALEAADEDHVQTIDVYVFDESGYLVDIGYGHNIRTNGTEKSFDVTLIIGKKRDVMVLANTRDIVRRVYPSGPPVDGTLSKEDFGEALVLELSGGWNSDKSNMDYIHIPMCGMRENVDLDGTATWEGTDAVDMIRMLARVNVAVTANNFELKSVRLHNYNKGGRVIPDPANGKWSTHPITFLPSIPAGTDKEYGPVIYTDINNNSLRNTIYMFEALKGVTIKEDPEEYMLNPCLVIGGIYNNSGVETYYRIDFTDQGANYTAEYFDILRNYSYNIDIVSVSGAGKPTPNGGAIETYPDNIEVGIIVWNDADMDEVTIVGNNTYSLSPMEVELWAKGNIDNLVNFKTTYPSWSYELSDKADPDDPTANPSNVNWLGVKSHIAGNEYKKDVNEILYDVPEYTNSTPRTAYLHFTSGRYRGKVTVKQYNYYIDNIGLNKEGDISKDGETRIVHITGIFDKIEVRAREIGGSYPVLGNTMTVTGNKSHGEFDAELDIPATSVDRTISFEYLDPCSKEWRTFRIEKQPKSDQFVFTTYVANYYTDGATTMDTSFEIRIYGKFPDIIYKVRAADNSTLGNAQISAGSTPENNPTSVTIGTGVPTSERMIYFDYSIDGGQNWVTMRYLNQDQSYTILFSHDPVIPAEGRSYSVTVSGTYRTLYIRTMSGFSRLDYITIPAGNTPVIKPIKVTANTTKSNRTVQFQYSVDQLNWITYSSAIQQFSVPKNYILKETGRMVAEKDLPQMENWATAMGIPQDYLTTRYPQHNTLDYSLGYSAANGGCANYSEPGYPKGTWRVPTTLELQEMCINWREIGMVYTGIQTNSCYWSNMEDGTKSRAYLLNTAKIGPSYGDKERPAYVRCVTNY